jgi:Zincin-like metallopeptidase
MTMRLGDPNRLARIGLREEANRSAFRATDIRVSHRTTALETGSPSSRAQCVIWSSARVRGSWTAAASSCVTCPAPGNCWQSIATLWEHLTHAAGADARDAIWQHPDLLPDADDLDEPAGFIDRVIGGDTSGIDEAIAKLEDPDSTDG